MVPDVASIMRKRYRMQRTLRLMAVILLIIWAVIAGYALVEIAQLVSRDSKPSFGSMVRDFLTSVPFLLTGAALALGSAAITRWILPIPNHTCPRCSYRLLALAEARCPECGLSLPPELVPSNR